MMCPICRDDLQDYGCSLECGHIFHKECIFGWVCVSETCPYCRKNAVFTLPLTQAEQHIIKNSLKKKDEIDLVELEENLDTLREAIDELERMYAENSTRLDRIEDDINRIVTELNNISDILDIE